MKSIEIEGKTVEEALNKALSELKTVKEMVNVELIDQGSKGLFNVIGKLSIIFHSVFWFLGIFFPIFLTINNLLPVDWRDGYPKPLYDTKCLSDFGI